jgi:hypothetical protein
LLSNINEQEDKDKEIEKGKYFENINSSYERRNKVYNSLLCKMKEDLNEINAMLNNSNQEKTCIEVNKGDKIIFNRLLPSRKTTIEFEDSSIIDEGINIKIPNFKVIIVNKHKENKTQESNIITYNEYDENLTTNVTFSDCNGTIETSQILLDTDVLNNFTKRDEK